MIATPERRRIYLFVGLSYGASILLAVAAYLTGGLYLDFPFSMRPTAFLMMSLLMFMPAVANVVTRLITREGWTNTLLRPKLRHGWPCYLAALILPALATIVGALLYYLLLPDRFDPTMAYARGIGLKPQVGFTDPWTFILTQTPITMLLTIPTLPLFFGEEFGWRAYLLPKLMPLGGRKAVLIVGVIHAVWHWPFFLMGYNYGLGYPGAPLWGMLLYVPWVCALSVLMGWVTLRSRSMWPAALAHGMINNGVTWPLLYSFGAVTMLIGPQPTGIIGALGYLVIGLVIWLSARALRPMEGPSPAAPKAVQVAAPGAAD
jgi:membrane protease YdiL (CAAX protease family)